MLESTLIAYMHALYVYVVSITLVDMLQAKAFASDANDCVGICEDR